MPATFEFTAKPKKGGSVKGLRVAASEVALATELAGEGLFLISAKQVLSEDDRRANPKSIGKAKFKRKDLVSFLLHVASYMEAGVPILTALQDYREPERPRLDEAVWDIRRRVEGGSSLSDAMLAHPGLFKPLQASMVRAGESTGRLDQALKEVIKLVEWEESFTAQVKQASTYPIIVLSLIGLIVLAVSIFALPGVIKLLKDFNVPLPAVTRVFIFFGEFMAVWGWLVVLFPVAIYFTLKAALKNAEFRLWWDTQILKIPVLGVLVTKISLSRFANFFAAQYRAGIPIVQVLRECESVTGNARLGLCVRAMREGVEGGERLTSMAEKIGYFPRLVVRMFGIGEEAGNLEETLGKVSQYFDTEVNATVKRVFQLIEPAMMVTLASILIFVAMAILLPIYSMIGGINVGK